MSHTFNIELEIHDTDVLKTVCAKLAIPFKEGTHSLYKTSETGIALTLPGWRYPAVVKADGSVSYDNYEGNWGKIEELHKVAAHYGFEKSIIESRCQGYSTSHTFNEQTRELELEIFIGE